MKRMFLVVVSALIVGQLLAQTSSDKTPEDRNFKIPLIGESAPAFTAESTNGLINFPADYGRKWKVLFSHPQDFTPVCSSEILELAYLKKEFDNLDVKLAVVSVDPISMHTQWKKALESLSVDSRGPVKITFPLIEDASLAISKQYGMIHPESNSTRSVRGVFIIDPDDIIQAIYFYPTKVGRSTDELLRTVKALQATREDKYSATPVNWQSGHDMFVTYRPKSNDVQSMDAPPPGFYQLAWFMWYKKAADQNTASGSSR